MAQKCKDERIAGVKRRKIAEDIWTAKFLPLIINLYTY
jgi:hypothetical protein